MVVGEVARAFIPVAMLIMLEIGYDMNMSTQIL